jgi:uncharacterized membrane protein YfcA
MEEVLEYSTYIVAGIVGGIVNTMAGGASIFILSLLIFFGMPANVANGTNRLGMLVQNMTGSYTFYKHGLLNVKEATFYAIPTLLGALVGAFVATDLSAKAMELIIGSMMVVLLVLTLWKPKVAAQKFAAPGAPTKNKGQFFIIFLTMGFYGGFIQAGLGLMMMVVLARFANLSVVRGNAIKMAITMVYTFPVLLIFIWNDQVDWPAAIALAVGQVIGTAIAGKFLTHSKKATKIVEGLLIAMIVLSIVRMFHLVELAERLLHNL